MLPNLLIIGAQKSGTSWFARMLSQHPDIHFHQSEIHFFDKSYNYQKGIEWYQEHFNDNLQKKWIGEKTPDYLWANGRGIEGHSPDVHRHIFQHLPDAKLIVILRNPIDRAVSAINHIIKSGRISPLVNIDTLIMGSKRPLIEKHGVIDKGYYHQQLSAYLSFFDRKQMLMLIYEEDLVQNPMAGLEKICNFLETDFSTTYFSGSERRVNTRPESKFLLFVRYYLPLLKVYAAKLDRHLKSAKYTPSMESRQHLQQLYAEPNAHFFDLFGREVPSWCS
jgi:hypothetical protein